MFDRDNTRFDANHPRLSRNVAVATYSVFPGTSERRAIAADGTIFMTISLVFRSP
jgi:hypothetical protein